MEQVFFNVPLAKLEPIFKRWIREAQAELQHQTVEPIGQPEQLLTIQQAAEFLSLSKQTVYGLVSNRQIPHSKKGKRLYFSKHELTAWIQEGKQKTIAEIRKEVQNG